MSSLFAKIPSLNLKPRIPNSDTSPPNTREMSTMYTWAEIEKAEDRACGMFVGGLLCDLTKESPGQAGAVWESVGIDGQSSSTSSGSTVTPKSSTE